MEIGGAAESNLCEDAAFVHDVLTDREVLNADTVESDGGLRGLEFWEDAIEDVVADFEGETCHWFPLRWKVTSKTACSCHLDLLFLLCFGQCNFICRIMLWNSF